MNAAADPAMNRWAIFTCLHGTKSPGACFNTADTAQLRAFPLLARLGLKHLPGNIHEAQPFGPFTLKLADGRRLRVASREFLSHSPSGRTITIAVLNEYDFCWRLPSRPLEV